MQERDDYADHDRPPPRLLARLRDWVGASGVTWHELGGRVGHGGDVARTAVRQPPKSKAPRIGMPRRFAAAADLPIEEWVSGSKTGKRKK
jgi:hypothetical protein